MPELPIPSSREIAAVLELAGWLVSRQRGSHRVYQRADGTGRVMVPIHSRDLSPGTLRNILAQAGMSIDELNELRR